MSRVEVTEKQLAAAATVWLQMMPKGLADKYIEHLVLKHYGRHNSIPRIEADIAEHLARRMTEVGWIASYEDMGNIFEDPVGR